MLLNFSLDAPENSRLQRPGAHHHREPERVTCLLLALLLFASWCLDLKAQHPDKPPQGSPAPRGQHRQNQLTWTLPTGWHEVEAGDMRLASFTVKGTNGQQADIGIVALPGQAGGDLPNVNRWREQVGLEPVKQDGLATLAAKVEIGGQSGRLYEQSGQNPSANEKSRVLAAVLNRTDASWFFKMNGDDELVAAQKPLFLEFLKSLHFQTADAVAGPPSPPPVSGQDINGIREFPAPPTPDWKVPPNWKQVQPGQMQMAKFATRQGNAAAEVSVVVMGGDGGGPLANVNRWRQQMGLGPLQPNDLPKQTSPLEVGPIKAQVADITSADRKKRLIAVTVPRTGSTWFYKLLGDEPAVAKEKKAFLRFVQSGK